jgi:SpoIID/LytB domain protein
MMTSFRGFASIVVIAALVFSAIGMSTAPGTPTAAAAGCPSSGGARVPEASASGSGITIRGHGWGHSLGMSQYGAQGAAKLGCNHDTILRTYYPGTRVTRTTLNSGVVLDLASRKSRSLVTAENGTVTWVVYTSRGPVTRAQPRGQTWTVKPSNYGSRSGLGVFDVNGARQLWVPSGVRLNANHMGVATRVRSYSGSSLTQDHRLRWGYLPFVRTSSGISVTERIPTDGRGKAVDKYLWGLAEVPVTWPTEALRAQADAARTYLVHTGVRNGVYVIGTTTASQVYSGVSREDQDSRYGSKWRSAVNATSGEIVVDSRGRAIAAMYSSSHGGHSENRAYVYGSQGGYGYLRTVDDSRWDLASSNPRRSWAVNFSPSDLAKKLGFSSVSSVSIGSYGTSARDKGLRVVGVSGGRTVTKYFTGSTVRYKLGLRSAGINVSWSNSSTSSSSTPPSAKQIISGDWDGDGRDDIGWYSNGQVSLRLSNGRVVRYRYGFAGATAVAGDWNNNGTDTIGVYSNGRWYLRNSNTPGPAQAVVRYGLPGDEPVTGQWTRSRQGIGVVRGSTWFLRTSPTSGAGQISFRYGYSSDTPLVVDWNGDGVEVPAVWRSGVFYLGSGVRPRSTAATSVRFGWSTDRPLLGNWDGRGGGTPVAVRGTTFYWRNDLRTGNGHGALTFPG